MYKLTLANAATFLLFSVIAFFLDRELLIVLTLFGLAFMNLIAFLILRKVAIRQINQ